jgi:hypothetical protein
LISLISKDFLCPKSPGFTLWLREAEIKQQEEVKAASEMQCPGKNGRFLCFLMDFVGFIYDLYGFCRIYI